MRQFNEKYQILKKDYINNQNKLILDRMDSNDQIKQIRKENELLVKQKEDRIEQLEKELKELQGQFCFITTIISSQNRFN